ncbi:MAG: sigma-70 family RNA polymerase sigma factor [Clostridia bacterium]|nr:sigma-70 family RNA polymerase sigma factor [Clostridia bacterium]
MKEIYEKYSKLVYNYLYKITNNKELSEDLMQETFYSAIKNINSFNNKCKISTWLCQIAKNKYMNEIRKQNVLVSMEEYSFDYFNIYINNETNNIEQNLIKNEEKELLYKNLNKLDDTIKELFFLKIKLNFTFKEIAIILGKTEEWARVNFYRTKIKIKEELKNEN